MHPKGDRLPGRIPASWLSRIVVFNDDGCLFPGILLD
jgi:hypothetical protein